MSRHVVDPHRPFVGVDRLLGDGQAQAKSRPILPELHVGIEEGVHGLERRAMRRGRKRRER